MAVLFALLVVVVIAGAVVVALRWPNAGVVADPSHDAPRAEAPEGRLGPAELRQVRFPIVFRGYRMSDVDALLDRLADQMVPQVAPTPAVAPASPAASSAPPDAPPAASGPSRPTGGAE
jgi:DivIVA domain-containing protein